MKTTDDCPELGRPCPDVRACALGGCYGDKLKRDHSPEGVELNKAGTRLLGMAVKAIRQLEQGNPFAKIAVGDFRRALGYADLSEEYLDRLDPLALPLFDSSQQR